MGGGGAGRWCDDGCCAGRGGGAVGVAMETLSSARVSV